MNKRVFDAALKRLERSGQVTVSHDEEGRKVYKLNGDYRDHDSRLDAGPGVVVHY